MSSVNVLEDVTVDSGCVSDADLLDTRATCVSLEAETTRKAMQKTSGRSTFHNMVVKGEVAGDKPSASS